MQPCSWVASQEVRMLLLRSQTSQLLWLPAPVILSLNLSLPLHPPLSFREPSCFPCSLLLSWSLLVCLLSLELICNTQLLISLKETVFKLGPQTLISSSPAFSPAEFCSRKLHLCGFSVYVVADIVAGPPWLWSFLSILSILVWVPRIISVWDLGPQVNRAHVVKLFLLWFKRDL